jgi:hypothetical protein
MSSWGNNDNAANAPYWAVNSTIVNATNVKANYSAPTADNVARLYANTTADVYTVGETIGLFAVDANESSVDSNVGHSGWVLRTTGSGGRANRVQQEVLVAISNFNGDDEDSTYKDAIITISSQPGSNTANLTVGNTATFRVTASITTGNTAAPLTYQWQRSATLGGSYVNVSNGTPANTTYTGGTTAALVITPTVTYADNNYYRVVINATGTGATAVTSTPAKLDVVA